VIYLNAKVLSETFLIFVLFPFPIQRVSISVVGMHFNKTEQLEERGHIVKRQ